MSVLGCMFVSCCKDDDIQTETSIAYTLILSPDLLKFVTPQVCYIDENGVLVTITGVEELDGKVIENSNSDGSAWSKQIMTGTNHKCWTIRIKFNRLDFHSYMGVRYIRNEFSEDATGKIYDFCHTINSSVISNTEGESISNHFQTVNMSVPSMEYHMGDDLETYLDNLIRNPDKMGFYVDGEGRVTEKDDFDL